MANSGTRTLLIEEIIRRGWRYETIGTNAKILRVIHPDGRSVLLRGTQSSKASSVGPIITADKILTLKFVESFGYEVPAYRLAGDHAADVAFLNSEKRIIVKPLDGRQSEGVTIDITTEQQLTDAIQTARTLSNQDEIVLQRHLEGNMYRLVALNGKMVAAAHRAGLYLVGDGKSDVIQLLQTMNADRQAGQGRHRGLPILTETQVADYVGEPTMHHVLPKGERLRITPPDSTLGSDLINVTDVVHQDWQDFVIKMTDELGLFIAGYDVIVDDIAKPMRGSYVPLLEINAMPGVRLHNYPTVGEPINIIPEFLDALFAK